MNHPTPTTLADVLESQLRLWEAICGMSQPPAATSGHDKLGKAMIRLQMAKDRCEDHYAAIPRLPMPNNAAFPRLAPFNPLITDD